MATDAQIAANQQNAQASTGPRTSEGKDRSSRNHTSHGLFATRDFVRTNETSEYDELRASLRDELRPESILEATLAAEIVSAAWRLRRCAEVEAGLAGYGEFPLDPMEDKNSLPIQNSVDRARGQAQRNMYRTMNELRRLQTERRFRAEFLPEDQDPGALGLASCPSLIRSPDTGNLRNRLKSIAAQQPARDTGATARVISRNAPCPCGSGAKFKRCCARKAPAVMGRAA